MNYNRLPSQRYTDQTHCWIAQNPRKRMDSGQYIISGLTQTGADHQSMLSLDCLLSRQSLRVYTILFYTNIGGSDMHRARVTKGLMAIKSNDIRRPRCIVIDEA